MKRKLKLIILSVFSLNFASGIIAHSCFSQGPRQVRVAIIQDTIYLRLKIKGFYELIDSAKNKALYRGKGLNTTITGYKGGILFGAVKSRSNRISIKPEDAGAVVINGRVFAGDIQLVKKDNGHLLVVNYINLDDYVKGILYNEVSHYWPEEVLKAQAIVCRSYAVYQMQENRSKDFDVTSDIYSQVYGGKTSERYRTNKVVEETKGRILVYQGKVFPAYYHATCAGHTEDAALLWNINLPPLQGVSCSFCKESPHFSWHYVLPLKDILKKLSDGGFTVGNITSIDIVGRDNSGRAIDLIIKSSKKDLKISTKDFRNIIGPNIIRSTNFDLEIKGDDAVLQGYGWGHGVGLCQWGAYFMGKRGLKYEEILQYYYPGSQVTSIP